MSFWDDYAAKNGQPAPQQQPTPGTQAAVLSLSGRYAADQAANGSGSAIYFGEYRAALDARLKAPAGSLRAKGIYVDAEAPAYYGENPTFGKQRAFTEPKPRESLTDYTARMRGNWQAIGTPEQVEALIQAYAETGAALTATPSQRAVQPVMPAAMQRDERGVAVVPSAAAIAQEINRAEAARIAQQYGTSAGPGRPFRQMGEDSGWIVP